MMQDTDRHGFRDNDVEQDTKQLRDRDIDDIKRKQIAGKSSQKSHAHHQDNDSNADDSDLPLNNNRNAGEEEDAPSQ